MKNKRFVGLIIVSTILIVGVLLATRYLSNQLSPVDSQNTQTQNFIISDGETTKQIAANLQKQGLILSSRSFVKLVQSENQDGKLVPGVFKLSPSMSGEEVLKTLTSGEALKKVTLIEGWRVEEMAQKLNKELGTPNEEFIRKAKEGYMFPDTYFFDPKVTTDDIIARLKNNFDSKYTSELQAKIKKNGLTAEEGVILASIVEREARSDEVRRMVASILLRRFKIDMGLNADATIQYALVPIGTKNPPANGWWKRSLTHDDLKIVSPYNTYLHAGLPPAPICNPSLSSLEAVANATSTPYLYYYHDSKGNSYYARTLDEHNANVASHR